MVPDPKQAESFILRLLIHYIGDIHQPLHATAKVNPNYPKGDMGGNLFTITES
jgi:S1/P1 Nuclease